MALRRHSRLLELCCLALAVTFLAAPATAWKTGQVTVFWGRNKAEGTLREACDTGRYSIVIISFYSVFGHGRYWGDLSGHPLAGIGDDIKHCQSKQIYVFLSIGGFNADQYSLPSSQSAWDVANNLWNAFSAGRRGGVFRPFGDAEVDGFDFFIEGWSDHYDELAGHLWDYNKAYRGTVKVQLSATPRCAYPDWRVEKALQTGHFARIHVRFYGDPRCSYNEAGLRGVMEQWSRWTAKYPESQVYLGLPAASSPGKNDVVSLKALYYDLLPSVQKAPNYGGVMLWDRFYDKQTNYGSNLKNWA